MFRLFQRRTARDSWSSEYVHNDSTHTAVPSAPAVRTGSVRRRGRNSSADKLYSCAFPGCGKKFCHETHARRHERNLHHFWRTRLAVGKPSAHSVYCRTPVAGDSQLNPTEMRSDLGVERVNYVADDWNRTAIREHSEPADSLITGTSADANCGVNQRRSTYM